MIPLKVVGFAGSSSQPSKTRIVVAEAAARTAYQFDGAAHVFDINDLGPDFGSERAFSALGLAARRHIDALLEADAIVVASPVYKGSYAGLFKHVFDLIDPAALLGKPVLLAATGGGDRHALVIEHQLRPLLGFFEAQTLATGFYACDRDFEGGRLASEAALARLDRAVSQFAPFLERPGRHRKARPLAVAV